MLEIKTLNKRLARTFNQRIIIKKREVIIVNGRKVDKWVDYYSCLSHPTELYGDELYKAIQVKFKTTGIFEVRYCQLIEDMRFHEKDYALEYNGILFDIYHIDYLKNDKFVVLLKVKREG